MPSSNNFFDDQAEPLLDWAHSADMSKTQSPKMCENLVPRISARPNAPPSVRNPRNKDVHCPDCRQILRGYIALVVHQRSGACERFFCREAVCNHVRVDENFSTSSEAKAWLAQENLDQEFFISAKKLDYAIYRCLHKMRYYKKSPQRTKLSSTNVPIRRRRKCTPKYVYVDCKAPLRLDKLSCCMCPPENKVDESDKKTFICLRPTLRYRIRGCLHHAHAQKSLTTIFHPITYGQYSWFPTQKGVNVRKHDNSNPNLILTQYVLTLQESQCQPKMCLDRCWECPSSTICYHKFTCSCPTYSREKNCNHVHLVTLQNVHPISLLEHDYCSSMAIFHSSEEIQGQVQQEHHLEEDHNPEYGRLEDPLVNQTPEDPQKQETEQEPPKKKRKKGEKYEEILPPEALEEAHQRKVQNTLEDVKLRLTDTSIVLTEREAILKMIQSLIVVGEPTFKILPMNEEMQPKEDPQVPPKKLKKRPKMAGKKKDSKKQITPTKQENEFPQSDLFRQCVEAPLDEFCWFYVLSLNYEEVLKGAKNLGTEEKRFLELYEYARLL